MNWLPCSLFFFYSLPLYPLYPTLFYLTLSFFPSHSFILFIAKTGRHYLFTLLFSTNDSHQLLLHSWNRAFLLMKHLHFLKKTLTITMQSPKSKVSWARRDKGNHPAIICPSLARVDMGCGLTASVPSHCLLICPLLNSPSSSWV